MFFLADTVSSLLCVHIIVVESVLCYWQILCAFFFFQAEDGIRDLVRSRGLGDVYKRQVLYRVARELGATKIALGHHRDDMVVTLLINMFFGLSLIHI